MISIPFIVYCDQCMETKAETTCLVNATLCTYANGTHKRFITFEMPEELTPKKWIAVHVGSQIKLYCPACKEYILNMEDKEEKV